MTRGFNLPMAPPKPGGGGDGIPRWGGTYGVEKGRQSEDVAPEMVLKTRGFGGVFGGVRQRGDEVRGKKKRAWSLEKADLKQKNAGKKKTPSETRGSTSTSSISAKGKNKRRRSRKTLLIQECQWGRSTEKKKNGPSGKGWKEGESR